MTDEYDVVIVGGGFAGTTLALLLGNHGLRVALVEARPAPARSAGQSDPRVSVLGISAYLLLRRINLWPSIEARGVIGLEEIHVTEGARSRGLTFSARAAGLPALGYSVENEVVLRELERVVERSRDIDVLWGARPYGTIDHSRSGRVTLHVQTRSGESALTCRLLVGADGARSWVRAQMGIAVRDRSPPLTCVVTTVQPEHDHANRLFERLQPSFAIMPMARRVAPDKARLVQVVWTVPHARAHELLALDDAEFRDALRPRFGQSLGELLHVGPRSTFPVTSLHAKRYAGRRIALIADAAHVIPPLSGQGLNLGLRDVECLAARIYDDPGAAEGLRSYERRRRNETLLVANAIDLVLRAVQPVSPAWCTARGLMLSALDMLPGLTTLIARSHAFGMSPVRILLPRVSALQTTAA